MTTASESVGRIAAQGRWLGPALFIAAVLAAIPTFWFGLVSLKDAWSTPEYSHGPLIPIISSYLFLRDMRRVPPASVSLGDRWLGVWIVGFALVLAIVGNLSRIPDIVTYALIIWVWGMVLASFGWPRGRQLWPSVVHLVFMLPLPAFIYWKLSIFLQGISSEIGVWLVRMMDIPVFLDGNVIDLGLYKLQVAEACSGLRYLFPILSFSYIFSLLYRGPLWHKLALLISAAPITVLMNSFRIGMIGVLVNSYGIDQAEGFLHAFEGWVIFGACVGVLLLLTMVFQRISGSGRSLSNALDLDFAHIPHELRRVRDHTPNKALIAAFGLIVAVSAATAFWPSAGSERVERSPLAVFPQEIAGWEGRRQYLAPNIEQVLGADDYLTMAFSRDDGTPPVDFFIAYYDKLTEGGGIHSPEVCIPAGGWEMSAIRQKQVQLDMPSGAQTLTVNRAIIQKGLSRQLVYYWFDQRGRRMTSDYATKAYAIYDSIVRGRNDGGLVRVITPITESGGVPQAEARLARFLSSTVPRLPEYIPH